MHTKYFLSDQLYILSKSKIFEKENHTFLNAEKQVAKEDKEKE